MIAARIASTATGDVCTFGAESRNDARSENADASISAVGVSNAEARRSGHGFRVEWRASCQAACNAYPLLN